MDQKSIDQAELLCVKLVILNFFHDIIYAEQMTLKYYYLQKQRNQKAFCIVSPTLHFWETLLAFF